MRKCFIVLSATIGILNAAEPPKNRQITTEFVGIYNTKEPFRAGNWQETFFLTDGSVLIHKPDEMVWLRGNHVSHITEEYTIGRIQTGFQMHLPSFKTSKETETFFKALRPELRAQFEGAQFEATQTPPKSLSLKTNSTKEEFIRNLVEAGLLEDPNKK